MAPRKSKKIRSECFIMEGEFGKYFSSDLDDKRLAFMKGVCEIPRQVKLIAPESKESLEFPPINHSCAFEIFFSECGLSFPLPGILVELMHELGIALPQLCPNVVRVVLCLQTLAEENGYRITLSDIFQLYTMKKGRTSGTFFLSPRSKFRVFADFPEKDEKWRKSYFFFPVDEFSYGPNTEFFVREWTHRPVKFPKKPLSHTFAEQFVKICNRSDLSWELFTCERIRSSCARIYSRSDLISSTPPSSPAVATNMSPLSYREEKRLQKEREKAREAREKEDKAKMVKALDDGKSRSSSGKGKSSGTVDPFSESKTSDHRDQKKVSSGKDIIRISDSRSSRSSREKEISEGGHSATSSRKRRNEEYEVPSLQRKSRSRLNDEKNPSEDAGTRLGSKPEEREDSQRAPESDLPTQLLRTGDPSVRRFRSLLVTPPKSPADFMRNFTPVGMRIPPFSDLKKVNRANYFRFADKLGELMLEYNTTFSCHESQLFPVNELDGLRARVAELEDEIRQLKEMEEENARAVAKANEIRERMLEAEGRCNLLEIAKTDLSEKLKIGKNLYLEACDKITSLEAEVKRSEEWCKIAAEKRDEELAAAKKDERMRLRELYSGLASKHETYYKAISDNEMIGTRLAETRANRELLEEILKGEISDIKAELESVKKDEEEAEKKAREVSALRPQPNEFTHLFVATPPEPVQETSLPEDDVAIDEFGTNKDLMADQDFEAAVLPEEMQQDPDVKDQ
ncbi:meiosis-specific protein ASY2-like [Arabidopsis lyrata subsp. lyrata]|uniref:meiosis-specific protein ASY2-like n=1 Tax=Arabidopsis lyrata subsp. lyrata TaxID=81972 RepID=UPI000A29DF88|nr:meiosis-specific protein ASY2-like [Arabidopsis lyrata subsp. lyrata]|eukprot:XP_020876137.1 meiosis-specific protein ASY2-like [Arabidopsis lyrata subsp. lyrata]